MKNEEFKDKVVLITGSSRGIGKETAVALSNLGASLVINGRDKERLIQVENLIKNSGGKVMSYCCDITNPDQVEKLIEKTIKTYGKCANISPTNHARKQFSTSATDFLYG